MSVTVSHTIGEGPWRSSSQPTPFITFCTVLFSSGYSLLRFR